MHTCLIVSFELTCQMKSCTEMSRQLLNLSFFLFSQGSFICSLVEYQPLTFNRWYVYPAWAYVLGWVMALSSILLVPGWALYKLGTGTGNLRQVGRLYNWLWSLIQGEAWCICHIMKRNPVDYAIIQFTVERIFKFSFYLRLYTMKIKVQFTCIKIPFFL